MTEANDKPKRKGRGPGKKPALVCTSIRLNREVIDYFKQYHPNDRYKSMREVLAEYVRKQTQLKESEDGTQKTVDE